MRISYQKENVKLNNNERNNQLQHIIFLPLIFSCYYFFSLEYIFQQKQPELSAKDFPLNDRSVAVVQAW